MFNFLCTTDKIYLILILSMRYTFIYDIYGNLSVSSYLPIKNLHPTCYSFRDFRNGPEDEKET